MKKRGGGNLHDQNIPLCTYLMDKWFVQIYLNVSYFPYILGKVGHTDYPN